MSTEHVQERVSDVYEIITEHIIEQLEKQVIPWRKDWSDAGLPMNIHSGRPYRGLNVMLLSMLGYDQNLFLTFNQAKDLGAEIKREEKGKGHIVTFWKMREVEDVKTKELKLIPLLRYYRVYNISQCENLPEGIIPEVAERPNEPIKVCEEIVAKMPKRPKLIHKYPDPYYNPVLDEVNMPKMKKFETSEGYYVTLFHELIHSTGHQSRLGRKDVVGDNYRMESYSFEELVAEIGACYLCSYTGIPMKTLDNSVAYIKGWLERLKDDKKFIVLAASQAQKAVDFILDKPKPEYAAEE